MYFISAHKQRIYALARDVGNPSYKDKFFPVARQKDMYLGFSWATGIVPGSRQEESSSEVRFAQYLNIGLLITGTM